MIHRTHGIWSLPTIVTATGHTRGERFSRQISAAFTSFDSGHSWSRHDFDATQCFDPWVVITPDGQVVVTVSAEHDRFPQQRSSGLLAFHSPDGGRTWDPAPVGLGAWHDHPTMALDLSTTSHRGFIYVLSHKPNGDADDQMFERRRAWIMRSTDGGQTFSTPLFVNDACGPPPGFSLPAVAADTSEGPFSGRLYFACRQVGGGRIVASRAADGREQWAAAVALGDESIVAEQRIPGLAVNNRGVLIAGRIDGRTAAGRQCDEAVHVASSLDGGASFSPFQWISTTEGCADTDPTGGDYFGLAAGPDGVFRIVWVETRNGVGQLLMTSLEVPKTPESAVSGGAALRSAEANVKTSTSSYAVRGAFLP